MNERQKALLEYMRTIAPHMRGVRSPEQLLVEVMKCVSEDVGVVGNAMFMAFAESGTRMITNHIDRLGEQFAQKASSALADLFTAGRGSKKRP